MHDTPMLRGIQRLSDAWLAAAADPSRRLLVWRLPANASRLLAAFFEMQRHDQGRDTPDYFLRLDTPYELGFRYSRQIKQTLLERYLGSQDELRGQGITLGWRGPHAEHLDSAAGVVQVLDSFAEHHGSHLRLLAAVLEPERMVPGDGFEHWVDAALAASPGDRLRLVLVDTEEDPRWQPLLERHASVAARIDAPVDMFAIARDTASQSGGTGPEVLYRQLLADLMLLLERGSPQQVVGRAERALGLAQRHGWQEQASVVQMMVAGAWLKAGDHGQAITAYRQARSAADAARNAGNAAAPELVMQSWFGEAGCWLTAKNPERAAQTYLQASTSAASIPHPMFQLEGQRMAGYCLLQHGKREEARTQLLEAIRIAKPLSTQDRKATTLPQALWDLLQLQDLRRAEKIQLTATAYLEQTPPPSLAQRPPACSWMSSMPSCTRAWNRPSTAPSRNANGWCRAATSSSARSSRWGVSSSTRTGTACPPLNTRLTTRFRSGANRRPCSRCPIPARCWPVPTLPTSHRLRPPLELLPHEYPHSGHDRRRAAGHGHRGVARRGIPRRSQSLPARSAARAVSNTGVLP